MLFLYGIGCTNKVWKYIHPYFKDFDIDFVELPHKLTLKSKNVDELTEWIAHLNLTFIRDSCLMIMIENPKDLSSVIKEILIEEDT